MSAPGLQGLRPWIIQRISAVYITLFIFYFSISLFIITPLSAQGWVNWVATPLNNISLSLFFIALLWHTWVGIRDVILDYVFNVVARMFVLTLVSSVLVGSGFWAFRALARVQFGS